jgi:polyisoprenoid-binding protein YceI
MSVVENAQEQLLPAGLWSVDPAHSAIEFRVKHMVVQTVKGRFRDFDGAIVGGAEPTVYGAIRAASLETLHEEGDAHLRSRDFFDVERYPEISSDASRVLFSGGDDGRFALQGELTMKGVTRPITLDGELHGAVVAPDGSEELALTVRAQLDRSDYGLVWNRLLEAGNVLVGDTVVLVLDVAAVRID